MFAYTEDLKKKKKWSYVQKVQKSIYFSPSPGTVSTFLCVACLPSYKWQNFSHQQEDHVQLLRAVLEPLKGIAHTGNGKLAPNKDMQLGFLMDKSKISGRKK